MLSFSTSQIVGLLLSYRYLIIFPIAFLEGPIISIICGWLVSIGELNFLVVYLLLIFANILGDVVYYALGYWGGRPLIRKWGHWFKLDLEQTEKMKNHFDNHGGKILMSAKIVPNFGTTPVLVGAGLARYSFLLFIRYCLTIEIFKTAVFLTIGYFAGQAYEQITVYLDIIGFVSSLLIVGLILGFWFYLRRKK